MSAPNPEGRRIDADVLKLIKSNHEVTFLDGLNEFLVKFHGPVGTSYAGGVWNVKVVLPKNYPFKSPSIVFTNRIFHPNIDQESGSVCMDVINQKWTPLYELLNIFEVFLPQLLTYPNPIDPLNVTAAMLMLSNKKDFEERVAEYVKQFASEKALEKSVENASSDSDSDLSVISAFSDHEFRE